MNELMAQIEFLLVGASFMLILLGLGVAVVIPGIDRWSKSFFTVFFMILTLYGVFGITDLIIRDRPDRILVLNICYYFESLFASILIPMMTVYLLHCCGEDPRRSGLFRVVAAFFAVFFIMLSLSPFSTLFYYAVPENYFLRGPLYILMIAVVDVILIFNLSGLIRRRNRLSKRLQKSGSRRFPKGRSSDGSLRSVSTLKRDFSTARTTGIFTNPFLCST